MARKRVDDDKASKTTLRNRIKALQKEIKYLNEDLEGYKSEEAIIADLKEVQEKLQQQHGILEEAIKQFNLQSKHNAELQAEINSRDNKIESLKQLMKKQGLTYLDVIRHLVESSCKVEGDRVVLHPEISN